MISVPLQRWLPLALVVLVAFWLRTHDLGARPMHADEANQAVKLGDLLDTGKYAFDPHDHHGPTLYYLAVPIAWVRGERTLATLTETTVRLLPAMAGTLSVALLAILIWPPARAGAKLDRSNAGQASATVDRGAERAKRLQLAGLAAAAFLAVSPPAVYYSRYFVQETLLLTFTLATCVCVKRWWQQPRAMWAITTGASVGLMLATKASAPVFLIAAAIGCLPVILGTEYESALSADDEVSARRRSRPAGHLVIAVATALLLAAAFYSSFGTHFAGLADATRVYTFASERATGGSGHEKPWWYYLQLFGWQKAGGLVWDQLAFSTLAICGAALAFTRRSSSGVFRWALLYTLLVATTLSLTPYKTPWHAIHLVPGLAALAASILVAIPRWWIGAVLVLVVLQLQFKGMQLAVFQRAADARNPYAYVHSAPDVTKFRALAVNALAQSPEAIVRVISTEYWPLPWYFRGLSRVGYWANPPADCDASLIITSEDLADTVRAKLHGSYRESLLGLRPGLLCVAFTRVP